MISRSLALAALLAAGATCAARAEGPRRVWIDRLDAGARLEVRTADCHFRFDVADPATGEATASLSRDGLHFGPADRVFLLGATQGRHPEGLMFVRMGQIEVGGRVELAIGTMDSRNRRITAPVQSIRATSADSLASP
jgi:hypothetical protein